MPVYELALPPNAFAVKLRKDTYEYPIDIDTIGFTRNGKDGSEIILPLFGGDENIGDILEGYWKKGWDSNMDADQPFTAILDGLGTLDITGEADVAGTQGNGWINGHLPIPLFDELEVQVSLEVPIDDTGAVANRDIHLLWYLRKDAKSSNQPIASTDHIVIWINVDESGLLMRLQKEISSVVTTLFDGSTYDDVSVRGTGDIEGTIWRLVFHEGHYGESSPSNVKHLHVYLKQSDTIVNAEAATEYELTTSPYNISDILFDIAWPAYQIASQNTSYFDSGGEAKSTYVKVDYPNFDLLYDLDITSPPVELFYGEVELWDGDPDAGGIRVYAPGSSLGVGRDFSDTPFIQNGLIRVEIVGSFPHISEYSSAAWNEMEDFLRIYDQTNAAFLTIEVDSIQLVTDDKIILNMKAHESDVTRILFTLTLVRGAYYIWCETTQVDGIIYRIYCDARVANFRFFYCPPTDISDDDLGLSASETSPPDNFIIGLDELIGRICGAFYKEINPITINESGFGYPTVPQGELASWGIFLFPFPLFANLFLEGEDGTLGGGATSEVDAAASDGLAARLDAQNDYTRVNLIGGTTIAEGRYLAVWRIRDTNQVAGDVQLYVQNSTDNRQLIEKNTALNYITVTATYAFYSEVFDIGPLDIGGDAIKIYAVKELADANEIWVDYILIIPIGNGESWPQDLAHSIARLKTQARRVFPK